MQKMILFFSARRATFFALIWLISMPVFILVVVANTKIGYSEILEPILVIIFSIGVLSFIFFCSHLFFEYSGFRKLVYAMTVFSIIAGIGLFEIYQQTEREAQSAQKKNSTEIQPKLEVAGESAQTITTPEPIKPVVQKPAVKTQPKPEETETSKDTTDWAKFYADQQAERDRIEKEAKEKRDLASARNKIIKQYKSSHPDEICSFDDYGVAYSCWKPTKIPEVKRETYKLAPIKIGPFIPIH